MERIGTLRGRQEKYKCGLREPTLSFLASKLQPESKQPISGNWKNKRALEWSRAPHRAFDVSSSSSSSMVSSFCDVGFLSKKDWATATGSSLIIELEIDAPSQEKGNKAAWNVSSVGILLCAAWQDYWVLASVAMALSKSLKIDALCTRLK